MSCECGCATTLEELLQKMLDDYRDARQEAAGWRQMKESAVYEWEKERQRADRYKYKLQKAKGKIRRLEKKELSD